MSEPSSGDVRIFGPAWPLRSPFPDSHAADNCCPIHKGKGDMNAKLSILAIIVIAATAQVASAQYYQPQHHYGAYPVQYPAAYNGYGNYHHASTLEEGMANGIANLIHSAGAANLLHS